MRKKLLRHTVGALGFALVTSVVSISYDTTATAGVPQVPGEASWAHAVSQLPEIASVVRERHVEALTEVRIALRVTVNTADELWVSSKGKASDESRTQLAIEMNRAKSVILLTDDEAEPPAQQEALNVVIEKAKGEVAAWEEAEAKRIAEEARVAEEARKAAAAASSTSTGRSGASSSSSSASTQGSADGAQQYLEGIAASFGGSISWSSAPCGRNTGSTVSGCYAGGSTVTISTSAYSSWSAAKGVSRNVVIHELSHMRIKSTCGTVRIGGDRFENVTDAYSVLIGASAGSGYGYNDNDVAIARAALGGTCS